MKFRAVLAAMTAAMLLAALTVASGGAAADPSPPAAKPTVVLVHGAFSDSSSWNGVIEQLEAGGYPVIAVANPLRGLRSDAQYVRGLLDHVEGPIILAGHSYGGSVMSEAADGQPNVKALVFIASFLLDPGESTSQLAAKFPGAQLGPALDPVPVRLPDGFAGNDLYIKQDEFPRVFAADVPAESMRFMGARANAQTVEVNASHAVPVS